MGIDGNGVRFLVYAQESGADFEQTATIGRQGMFITPRQFRQAVADFGRDVSNDVAEALLQEGGGYAEGVLRYLGASSIRSLDVSLYEGATDQVDMNDALPLAMRERFTAVLDGGSLEHVFWFPLALKNCMEMIALRGHYMGITPMNNFAGHGFYQFSPELYYGAFCEANGFRMRAMFAFEDRPSAAWYAVRSPLDVGERVTFQNSRPAFLAVLAQRLEIRPVFERAPQQSDYRRMWQGTGPEAKRSCWSSPPPIPLKYSCMRIAKRLVPRAVRRELRKLVARGSGARRFDRRFFIPTDIAMLAAETALARSRGVGSAGTHERL